MPSVSLPVCFVCFCFWFGGRGGERGGGRGGGPSKTFPAADVYKRWVLFCFVLFLKKTGRLLVAGVRKVTQVACPDFWPPTPQRGFLSGEMVPHSGQNLCPPPAGGSRHGISGDTFILSWPENLGFQSDSIPNGRFLSLLLPTSTFSLSPKIRKYF